MNKRYIFEINYRVFESIAKLLRYLNAEIFRENVVIARCIFSRSLITRYQMLGEDLANRQERFGAVSCHKRNTYS